MRSLFKLLCCCWPKRRQEVDDLGRPVKSKEEIDKDIKDEVKRLEADIRKQNTDLVEQRKAQLKAEFIDNASVEDHKERITEIQPSMLLPVRGIRAFDMKNFVVYKGSVKLFEKNLTGLSSFATYKDFMSWLFKEYPVGTCKFYVACKGYWKEYRRVSSFVDCGAYKVKPEDGPDYIIMTNLSNDTSMATLEIFNTFLEPVVEK